MRFWDGIWQQNPQKPLYKLHKATPYAMYTINEILENIVKIRNLWKKLLQNAFLYYIIVKRGMTYDDVGGYQSQALTHFAVNFHGECPNREFGRHGHWI